MSNETTQVQSIGFSTLLGVLFIGLKLTGHIAWSWLWVLAPLWGPIALMLVIAAVAFLALCITELLK